MFQLIFSKFRIFIPSICRIINWQYNSKVGVPGENLRVLNICQSSWNFLAPKREQAAICFSGTKSLLDLCILGRSYASWLSLPFNIGKKTKTKQKTTKPLQLLTIPATPFAFNYSNLIPVTEHYYTARAWRWAWNTVVNRIRSQKSPIAFSMLQIRSKIIRSTTEIYLFKNRQACKGNF